MKKTTKQSAASTWSRPEVLKYLRKRYGVKRGGPKPLTGVTSDPDGCGDYRGDAEAAQADLAGLAKKLQQGAIVRVEKTVRVGDDVLAKKLNLPVDHDAVDDEGPFDFFDVPWAEAKVLRLTGPGARINVCFFAV